MLPAIELRSRPIRLAEKPFNVVTAPKFQAYWRKRTNNRRASTSLFPIDVLNASEWNNAAKTSLGHLTALHVALSELQSPPSQSLDATMCERLNVPVARVFCG